MLDGDLSLSEGISLVSWSEDPVDLDYFSSVSVAYTCFDILSAFFTDLSSAFTSSLLLASILTEDSVVGYLLWSIFLMSLSIRANLSGLSNEILVWSFNLPFW